MSNIKTLGSRIKEERIRLGLKQGELAKKISKRNTAISSYENGDSIPPSDILAKLADIFQCSTDYLLGRTFDRNSIVYTGVIDGTYHELEINKSEVDMPDTPEKFARLIRKLDEIGFDIDKLMNEDYHIDLDKD